MYYLHVARTSICALFACSSGRLYVCDLHVARDVYMCVICKYFRTYVRVLIACSSGHIYACCLHVAGDFYSVTFDCRSGRIYV